MYARSIAAVLLGLCACNEAAPVRAAKVEEVAPVRVEEVAPVRVEEVAPASVQSEVEIRDPWIATLADEEEGDGPLRYMAQPELEPPVSDVVRPAGFYRRWKAVLVRREGIAVAGKVVLPFVDGAVPQGSALDGPIRSLRVALERGYHNPLFVVDRRLRYADLIDVLFASRRAGAMAWGVAVRRATDPPGTASGQLTLELPHDAEVLDDEPPTPATIGFDRRELALYMRITADAVELGELLHTGEFRWLGRVASTEGWAPVQRIAQAAAGRDAGDVWGAVVFGADDEVPLERVVDALTATTGECGLVAVDRTKCWFSVRLPVGGEHSLQAMSAGRGRLIVEEGEQRSTHASGYCSGLVHEGVTSVYLGRFVDDMGDVHGTWLSVHVADGETTVRVVPPWRETEWNWKGPDKAITLTRRSGCARFATELKRQPHDSAVSEPMLGRVELDCTVDGATVRGELSFAGCPACCD